jgi:hypothetical protein
LRIGLLSPFVAPTKTSCQTAHGGARAGTLAGISGDSATHRVQSGAAGGTPQNMTL